MTALDVAIVTVGGAAAFYDYRFRRIPNWLIAAGLATGILLGAFQGSDRLLQNLLGFVCGIAVLIVPFAFGWIGAGDVKYLGVVGAMLGAGMLPRVFFYSALCAGVIAVASLAFGKSHGSRFNESWLNLKLAVLTMGRLLPEPVSIQSCGRGGSVPWGVAFAAGTVFAYFFDSTGSWAGF